MKSLVNYVISIAVLLILIFIGSILWFLNANSPKESQFEVDPLEAIIHDQMYHQDSEDAQDPHSILQQFRRKTPLPSAE